jgi:hypothetical protein
MLQKTILYFGLAAGCIAGDTLTLNEAETLVAKGKAVLVEVNPSVLEKVMTDQNATATPKEEPVPTVKTVERVEALPKVDPKPEIVKIASVPVEGVDISMPTTLSNFLPKLSKITGETYFCEDDMNIPSSAIKITGIKHLERYLEQVSKYRIEILKDSEDITLPKVLRVYRAGDKK